MVPALAGQWILLFTLYLGLTQKIDESKLTWIFLIILSSLINFYFMVPIVAIYSLLRIFNLKFEKEIFFKLIKDFFIIGLLLLLTLYIVGYFEVRMIDILALGFGRDKLNLLSIFDSNNSFDGLSWSWFLPDIKLTQHEEFEGFNYLGLGQIIMLIFVLILFFRKKYKKNLFIIKNSKEIKYFIFISIFMTLWALSNKISFGSYTLIEIPLNKYIYGVLSIVRPTGRLFWIVNNFILIMSIVIIFKCFNKKNSLLIITFFLIIQVVDTSAGIKQRINFFIAKNESFVLKDKIWNDLFKKVKIVKTTYPRNYPGYFHTFSYAIEKNNIEKTNLVKMARINRKAVAEAKYHLYDKLRKKRLAKDVLYVIDNLGHLRHLKYLLKNEDVGFFNVEELYYYGRDNFWVMVANEKNRMNSNDKKKFDEISPKLLEINEKKNLKFENNDNYYGFGWSHNSGKPGIWSEGPMSTLFFRTDKNYGDLKLEILCQPYITKKKNLIKENILQKLI
jgi:hypothetical protein